MTRFIPVIKEEKEVKRDKRRIKMMTSMMAAMEDTKATERRNHRRFDSRNLPEIY